MKRVVRLAGEIRGTSLADDVATPEELLLRPETLFVENHPRTAVAFVLVDGMQALVRRFKPRAWYHVAEEAITGTPASRAWRNAHELLRSGFAVPPPLALVETFSFGLPQDSYFISRAVPGAERLSQVCRDGRLSRRLLRVAARELRRLHDRGFYTRHADAEDFLVRMRPHGDADFFLLGLENVRPGTASRRQRLENLLQLLRSVPDGVGPFDRIHFLGAYLSSGKEVAHHERWHALRAWTSELTRLAGRRNVEYRRPLQFQRASATSTSNR